MDHEVSVTNPEIDIGQYYLQYSMLGAEKQLKEPETCSGLTIWMGRDRLRAHEKITDKVSGKSRTPV